MRTAEHETKPCESAMMSRVSAGSVVLAAAEVLEHVLEGRDHEGEQHRHHAAGDDDHDARIDHRAAHLADELLALLEVDRRGGS